MLAAITTFAAQIGDSVTSQVVSTDRVTIPGNTTTEITHITLDSGVWSISGQINFLSENTPTGIIAFVGDINVTAVLPLNDSTHAIQTDQISPPGLLIMNVGLPGRVLEVEDGTDVFLLGYVLEPAFPSQGASGWGYITAVKIRNNIH